MYIITYNIFGIILKVIATLNSSGGIRVITPIDNNFKKCPILCVLLIEFRAVNFTVVKENIRLWWRYLPFQLSNTIKAFSR